MRLYIILSKSKELIPFNYQSYLTGAIHKWLGADNELHGKPSLYSFSWLQNVDVRKDGIMTKDRSVFFISAHDDALIKQIVTGIQKMPSVCFGIDVQELQLTEDPAFSNKETFFSASPIFIKRKLEEKTKHIEYHDPNSSAYLTETLQKKLKIAGLQEIGIKVSFDKNFPFPRTKIITYKEISNRVNICPVTVEGTPEQIAFAWNVGIGNSTGIGFGALK